MTDLDDKLRQVIRDDRWTLPTWPDPMARITSATRRHSDRQQRLAAFVVAAVVAVVALVLVPLVAGSKGGPKRRPFTTPTAVCRSGWRVAPEPFATGDRSQRLFAIGAASSGNAWAVGERFGAGGVSYPLIEHWDGRAWTIEATGNRSQNPGSLYAITVVGPKDVWAVGGRESPRNAPLVERWNGTSWADIAVPALTNAGPHQIQTLVGVAGTSANNVWALGSASLNGTSFENPLLHWNGRSWTRIASPPASAALFTAIAVDRVTGLPWVSGGQLRGSGETSTFDGALLQSWNGSAWTDRQTPGGPLPLTAVAFAGPQQIWAIRRPALGASPELFRVGGTGASAVMHWRGRRWTRSLSSKGNLDGIGVVSNHDVWIAGSRHGPLLMHWDGRSWTTISGSAPVALPDGLSSITLANDQSVLALGVSTGKPGGQTALWTRCAVSARR